jgi:dipeptidyl aminopeptidase/acylaminoacyl peptidase
MLARVRAAANLAAFSSLESRMRLTFLLLGLGAACSASAAPLSLEQIMADPDWIGPPVEAAYWSLDGRRVHYQLKREGSVLRDDWRIDLADGTPRRLEDTERPQLDAPMPVFDRARRRAVFVRNGDVFLRDMQSGVLQQLSRGDASEAAPRFSADERAVIFLSDREWKRFDLATRLLEPAAVLKAEKDPAAASEPDALRDMQLRLFDTLAREKADRDAQRERDLALRRADPSRGPAPVYLGEDLTLVTSALAPDGRHLLAVTEPKGATPGRAGKMPKYVTESGYEEVEDVRVRVGRNAPPGQRLWLVALDTATVTELAFDALPGVTTDPLADLRRAAKLEPLKGPRALRVDALQWNDDGSRAAVQLRAVDNKDRWLATVDLSGKTLELAHRLTDSAWINWNFNEFGWLRDGRTLWLLSEESGWSQLYLVPPGGGPRALTRGQWEVSSPVLSADGTRFLFVCNRAWPGDYELCAQDVGGGGVRELTALDGVESFVESPDGTQLLVSYSGSYLPAQLALLPARGAAAEDGAVRKLTDTRSAAYRAQPWQVPEFVQVPSSKADAPLWGKLYRPAAREPGERHPIVLFVHGAGYTQNTHARYPYYFREQMFHNLLAQEGYLVLDLDYRASEGYGRGWRTAIHRRMGQPELEDLIDGVQWLVREQQGDAANVGVYGGSYGGFMTLMAMFRAPEVFHAGAALRPVTDWTQYNHEYTANILETPELAPQAYRDSSPIEHAAGLRGHLLIAHGMLDDNVFFQDSVRLAQRLIELKKEHWELAPYPLERHSFVRADAWLDEFRRVHALFERVLRD